MTIFYLIADDAIPSWGTGMLYEHVRLLREQGRDARVLHHRSPYRPGWFDIGVPVMYLDSPDFSPRSTDVVVVPEVLAAHDAVQAHPWRRIVFVQGSFLILGGLRQYASYAELGYESAMAVLPHVKHVVDRYFGVEAHVVPPFIAPYFYAEPDDEARRQRRVVFVVKDGYRQAGIEDHDIALELLQRELGKRSTKGWSLTPLRNLTHQEAAELMRTSSFLVNVNTHEAFNTTVPEAMAAGCVPVCYEAGGGRDFLVDGENGLVHRNRHVFELIDRLLDFVDHYDERADVIGRLRAGGQRTAAAFSEGNTAAALERFARNVIDPM